MEDVITASPLEERIVLRATEKRIPVSGAFELLPLCNLNCRMCYIRPTAQHCPGTGELLPVSFWLEQAKALRDAGTLFLLLTGGEPFLYPGFRELYEALYAMGFILSINTNGTLIGPGEAAFLAAHMPRRVNITLYGTTAETYRRVTGSASAYEKTLSGIRALTAAGVPVKMNVSLIPENARELRAFYRVAEELGIPPEVNTYMYPARREETERFDPAVRLTPEEAAEASLLDDELKMPPEAFQDYLRRMAAAYDTLQNGPEPEAGADPTEQLPCRAARSSFWLNWKGELSPCVFLTGEAHSAVSLRDTPILQAWDTLTAFRDTVYLPAKCTRCTVRRFCPVCAAAVWHENRDRTKAPEYLCRMTEEKLRLAKGMVNDR